MKAVIASKKIDAVRAIKFLGLDPEKTLALSPGAAIFGYGIDDLLLVDWKPGDGRSDIERKMAIDWFENVIRPRLPMQRFDAVCISKIELVELI